jgi:hypothetical protein
MRPETVRPRSRAVATATFAVLACLAVPDLPAQDAAGDGGIIRIKKQGSFYYGGSTITAPGDFDPAQPFGDNTGETFDIDKGYAFFQIPPNPRQYPIVMWHGGGQHGKTYEDFEDRDNYQSIFLRKGFSVYIIDQPRTGKAGYPSFTGPFGTLQGEQIIPDQTLAYGIKVGLNNFRLGTWDDATGRHWFPGVLFPHSAYALDQLNAQTIPIINTPLEVNVSAQAALFRKIGPAILITHSASGGPGWHTAIRAGRTVVSVVAYEPVGFVFPEGEVPEGETDVVPQEEFHRLTRIPIQIIWGDHIDSGPLNRTILERSRRFAEAINRHGGDAQVIHLPEVGIHGNTHFPFADLNNHRIADLLSTFLHRKGLDRRAAQSPAVAGR